MIIQGQDAEGQAEQGCGLAWRDGIRRPSDVPARRGGVRRGLRGGVVVRAGVGLQPAGARLRLRLRRPRKQRRQLSSPSSVAVDEASGDVYVSDSANNRVDQFEPERDSQGAITGYAFKRAWGWGVKDGEKRYETCESECKEGIKGPKFFKSPGQIAVDNSTGSADPSKGDVYVVANHIGETEKGYGGLVYELGPQGEPVSTTEQHGPDGAPAGQPLPAGQPPMALGTIEEEFKPEEWRRNEETATEEVDFELEVIQGVAVDANGLVWLYGEDGVFTAFTARGVFTEYFPAVEPSELGLAYGQAPGRSGIAVRTLALGAKGSVTQDRLYARYEAHGEALEGKEEPKKGLCIAHPCPTVEINAFGVEAERSRTHRRRRRRRDREPSARRTVDQRRGGRPDRRGRLRRRLKRDRGA